MRFCAIFESKSIKEKYNLIARPSYIRGRASTCQLIYFFLHKNGKPTAKADVKTRAKKSTREAC